MDFFSDIPERNDIEEVLGIDCWYNFWTQQSYESEQTVTVDVDLKRCLDGMREWGIDGVRVDAAIRTLPLFIKAGAIIPTGPVMQYAS